MFTKYAKIIRYLFAGGFATVSSLLVLFICVNYFKWWYLSSAVLSFSTAVIIGYILHKFWVFKNYRTNNIPQQFLSFLTFGLMMLGLNTLMMYIFVDIFHVWYLLAQVICSIITAFINFICFNKVIFKKVAK